MTYFHNTYNGNHCPRIGAYLCYCTALCTSFTLKSVRNLARSFAQTMMQTTHQTIVQTIHQTTAKPIRVFARHSARNLTHFPTTRND